MPRNVRNFWLEVDVDGRTQRITGGPRAANGGFELTVKQRDEGAVTTALRIWGHPREDGTLALKVYDAEGETVHIHETKR